VQPISQADFDPSCFRLIRTSGVLTVTRGGGNPTMIVPFEDTLYFTNIPDDNTNVLGEVYYTFLALDGPCSMGLTPYQEVASGYDNEKFNGDYGVGVPGTSSLEPDVTINKVSAPSTLAVGGTTTYTIPFANTGTQSAGLTLSSGGYVDMPLVISDTVPNGMQYVGGSATYHLSGSGSVTIRYSTNSGATWSTSDPGTTLSSGPDSLVVIQWWLDQPLPAGSTGNYAQFQATVPSGYTGDPFIENTACIGLGDADPFACDPDIVIVQGTGAIGDFVWRDENNDGQQTGETANGINGVAVSLYWDRNGNGQLDDSDLLLSSQDTYTSGNAGYYQFTQLPAANYLVVVDKTDSSIPTGYRLTTPGLYAVALSSGQSYQTADFGFGPSLTMDKQMVTAKAPAAAMRAARCSTPSPWPTSAPARARPSPAAAATRSGPSPAARPTRPRALPTLPPPSASRTTSSPAATLASALTAGSRAPVSIPAAAGRSARWRPSSASTSTLP